MPDDSPLQPGADFPATESGLEFVMEQIAALPTRLGDGSAGLHNPVRRRGDHSRDRGFLAVRSGMRSLSLYVAAIVGALAF
jgi:hypothetical protein